MAIRAESFHELSDEELEIVNQLEASIDRYLEKHYKGDGMVCVPIKGRHKHKVGIREELIRRYKEAGWSEVYYNLMGRREDQFVLIPQSEDQGNESL